MPKNELIQTSAPGIYSDFKISTLCCAASVEINRFYMGVCMFNLQLLRLNPVVDLKSHQAMAAVMTVMVPYHAFSNIVCRFVYG